MRTNGRSNGGEKTCGKEATEIFSFNKERRGEERTEPVNRHDHLQLPVP